MKRYLLILFIIAGILLQITCKNEEPKDNDLPEEETADTPLYKSHTEWSYNLGMYEVNIRQYTSEGTFKAFEAHLPRLKDMGVGILWLMPIHPIGEENRIGSLGSYYSVKDYRDVNPEFGTMNDFKNLVVAIHEQGMFVIIDWVANHTAWDNDLTINYPEFYTKDDNGNFIPPPGTNWSDVIDLDFSNTSMQNHMEDLMKYWITETGIDGFRCDAVDFVPMSFWSNVIEALKEVNPGILMLAEGDKSTYHTAGFDITYAWAIHGFESGILKAIYDGSKTAIDLGNYLQRDFNIYSEATYRLYFTSNHDENSWNGTVFEQFGESAEAFAVLTHTLHGMPLIYSGQEAGLNKRLAFFDKDLINWNDHEFEDLYTKLLHLKKENKALWNGEAGARAELITTSNDTSIFAFMREKDEYKIFGAFNLSVTEQTFILDDGDYTGNYTDVFKDSEISVENNHEFTLAAWEYILLELKDMSHMN
ncbi:alpha-amylase family glycosyl hydrolase [Bacteroidota bacterium]